MRFSIGFAAVALASITPAMAQDAPHAAALAPKLEPVFTIVAELQDAVPVGETGRGMRRFIPIIGGSVHGEGIHGTVLPGAWDWQIDRPDGCTDLKAEYFLKTDDGALINVLNHATICRPAEGEPAQTVYTRPQFEPPVGKYEWMGRGVFVGRLERAGSEDKPAVQIRIFQVR